MEVGGRRENPATAGFEDGGRGLEPRHEDVFGGAGKCKEVDSSLRAPQKEQSPVKPSSYPVRPSSVF